MDFCKNLNNNDTDSVDIGDCIGQPDDDGDNSDVVFGTGLSEVPGGDKSKSIMSWHYYFPLFLYGMKEYLIGLHKKYCLLIG